MINVLRILKSGLLKASLVMALVALAVGLFPERAQAQAVVIDDFVSGTATIGPACHSVGYASHSDASILGGKRQIVVIEGHSCVTGNSPRASYDAATQTAEWWGRSVGNSAVGQWLAYGTAIGNVTKPWAVNPEIALGPQTPLNLSLTTADEILLDMARVDPETNSIRVELFAGNGQRFGAWFTIAAGLNSLPLSDFIGLTDAAAADIDGIEFSGQAGGDSITRGNGHIFNEISINPAVTDSDGDGVPDDQDAFPNSDLNPTVAIGPCDSGVANQLFSNGATMNDLIGAAAAGAQNHGAYVSAVTKLADGWKKAGLITGRDQGKITSCAARSDAP